MMMTPLAPPEAFGRDVLRALPVSSGGGTDDGGRGGDDERTPGGLGGDGSNDDAPLGGGGDDDGGPQTKGPEASQKPSEGELVPSDRQILTEEASGNDS